MFWAEIWKKMEFLCENFQFLEVKISIYLNRRVFVMIKKHNLPEAPKEREMTYNDKTHVTYETANIRTKQKYNRRTTLEMPVEQLLGCLNQFYSRVTSPSSLNAVQNIVGLIWPSFRKMNI